MASNHHARPAPFLKWAGGKTQLLKQYEPFFPTEPLRGYYEPFAGSGAVFFHLRGRDLFQRYELAESNAELINCYRVVRDDLDGLIDLLARHQAAHGADYYYTLRACDRDPAWPDAPPTERAARLIYLNKTCYNGLWRVNSRGEYNVPMGSYRRPAILDESRLRAASEALQGVTLAVRDFQQVVDFAGPGDFVYFDPPYVPLSHTSNFTSYSRESFGEAEHRALADTFAALDRQGCRVMLSNSDTPLVRELYRNFRVEGIAARRAINSAPTKRGPVGEVLVLNY